MTSCFARVGSWPKQTREPLSVGLRSKRCNLADAALAEKPSAITAASAPAQATIPNAANAAPQRPEHQRAFPPEISELPPALVVDAAENRHTMKYG
jgi:hypothetical protein